MKRVANCLEELNKENLLLNELTIDDMLMIRGGGKRDDDVIDPL